MKPVKKSNQIIPSSGKINLSFAGCGFLGIYHVGVASCFKKYAPHVYQEKIAGASAGALVACALIADCSLGDCTTFTLNLALECRKHFLGPFSPNFHLVKDLKMALEEFLPMDAHERATGKLHVSLTRFPDFENVLVSKFNSREDLLDYGSQHHMATSTNVIVKASRRYENRANVLQALICSSYVPFYSGVTPPCFQGKPYFDGAFSNNLPTLDQWTVKISPFSGESDICPDDNSKSFHHINIAGTSAQLNCNNAYRASVAFLPPSPEILSEMCQTGFEDALRFLRRNGLISCSQHISIHSEVRSSHPFKDGLLSEHSIHMTRAEVLESVKRARVSGETNFPGSKVWKSVACLPGCRDFRHHDGDDNDTHGTFNDDDDDDHSCEECQKMSENSRDDKPPSIIQKALNDACAKANKGFKAKLYKYKHLMWLAAPYVIPCSYTYSFCKKFFSWAPNAPTSIKVVLDNIYNLFVDVLESDSMTMSLQSKKKLVSWISLLGQYCGLHRCHKKELYSIFFPDHDEKKGGDGVGRIEEDMNEGEVTSSNKSGKHEDLGQCSDVTFLDGLEVMKVSMKKDVEEGVSQNTSSADAVRDYIRRLSMTFETSNNDQSMIDSNENGIKDANQSDDVLSYCYLKESDDATKVNTVEIISLQHISES